MNQRLKHARLQAGFNTASAAIKHFNWNSSAYRAHENGQNNYKVSDAEMYAEAYGVSASWLLVGEHMNKQKNKKPSHKHNCVEHIHAAAMLLKEDPSNSLLLEKIQECILSHLEKIS